MGKLLPLHPAADFIALKKGFDATHDAPKPLNKPFIALTKNAIMGIIRVEKRFFKKSN